MPKQTGLFRWIIELSSMINNEEVITFKDYHITGEEFAKSEMGQRLKERFQFGMPRLVLCRPVFQEEIDEGLDISFRGSCFNEETPKITDTLDGLYKLLNSVSFHAQWVNSKYKNPTSIVGHIIGNWFYDCMSAGMPTSAVVGARLMIKKYNCNLSEEVYPGGEGKPWQTLGDFMRETEHLESREKEICALMPQKLLTSGE